jgi:hypothetical protein
MAVFPGTYVQIGMSPDAVVNHLIDDLLTPRMLAFRQIHIYDEQSVLQEDNATWKNTYGNWNPTFRTVFKKNGAILQPTDIINIDYRFGTFQVIPTDKMDTVHVSYNFDYFPVEILTGLLDNAVNTVNTSAYGPPTNYNLDNMPPYWDGVVCDIAFSMAMERLIMDYDLWHERVVFAINGIDEGGDILSALETLKTNSEERANQTLQNEKFKNPPYLAPPTMFYYQAIRGFGRSGMHTSSMGYGKMRGAHFNRYR